MAYAQQAEGFGYSFGQLVDTLRALVSREFRMRYKGSFFGILWTVLSPLGTVAVLEIVFTRIIPFGNRHFGAFMYSALLPWVWFSSAVQTSATTLNEHRDLVRTPFFAKPMLPGAVTCTNFLLYVCALPVLVGLMLSDGLRFTPALFALPAIWIVEAILTLGFTVFISAIGLLVRDVQHLMGVVLMLWFYLTPIFYDLKQLPSNVSRWFALNPMATVVTAHRDVVMNGQVPNWTELARWGVIGMVMLGGSLLMFRRLEDAFVDET